MRDLRGAGLPVRGAASLPSRFLPGVLGSGRGALMLRMAIVGSLRCPWTLSVIQT